MQLVPRGFGLVGPKNCKPLFVVRCSVLTFRRVAQIVQHALQRGVGGALEENDVYADIILHCRGLTFKVISFYINENIHIVRTITALISIMASKFVGKLVKPPISLFGLEGRYVNALYSAASKNNKLDAVEGDLKKLSGLYKTDPRFKDFMINPLISPFEKSQLFAGDLKNKLKLSDLSVTFLSVVSENRRLKNLPEMESAFHQIMMSVRNELPVSIISAKPLADAKKKDVEDSLKAFTTKKLIIEYKTDPSILGGLIVDFNGEHYVDMSVRTRVRVYSNCCSV